MAADHPVSVQRRRPQSRSWHAAIQPQQLPRQHSLATGRGKTNGHQPEFAICVQPGAGQRRVPAGWRCRWPSRGPCKCAINSTNLMSLPGCRTIRLVRLVRRQRTVQRDFIQRSFPLDPQGNSYRGIRDQTSCDPTPTAWRTSPGTAPLYRPAYANAYFKQNNLLENDWSDLMDLIAVLNSANGYQRRQLCQGRPASGQRG